jgi:hypothetical protein
MLHHQHYYRISHFFVTISDNLTSYNLVIPSLPAMGSNAPLAGFFRSLLLVRKKARDFIIPGFCDFRQAAI